jgi:protein-S-isoprenylcysteine O-methyltransferase Ste14
MGAGSFFGGVVLCILAVLLGLFGIVVLLGFVKSVTSSLDVPLGIIMIIVALVLFLFGWYSYKSGEPRGTMNVHNQ